MAKLSYKVSYYVFYVCVALILVVLGMFYFVGYNNPVGEYNEPQNTEALMYLMYAMFGVSVIITLGVVYIFGRLSLIWKGIWSYAACAILTAHSSS